MSHHEVSLCPGPVVRHADFEYSIPVKSFPITCCVNPSARGFLSPRGYLNGCSSCEKLHSGKWQEICERKGSNMRQRLETSFTFVDVGIHYCLCVLNQGGGSFSPASPKHDCLPLKNISVDTSLVGVLDCVTMDLDCSTLVAQLAKNSLFLTKQAQK